MAAVRIEALFVLGTYQGHRSDGSADTLPDPARLHAALVAAAGLGPRANAAGNELTLNPEDVSALRWLETNPPVRILWPPHQKVAAAPRIAYRNEGVVVKEVGVIKDKVVGRSHSDATALAGPVAWEWPSMPEKVVDTLRELCPEVPSLGETTSPVRLRIAVVDTSPGHDNDAQKWVLDRNSISLDPAALDVRVPHVGRTGALIEAHAASRKGSPRPSQDGHAWTNYPAPSPVTPAGLRRAAYVPERPPAPELPWTRAILIPISRGRGGSEVPEGRRVSFAVSVHRALIARIGTGAVPSITGAYEPGVRRPPNRLAIHYLTSSMVALMDRPGRDHRGPMLALLLPADCDPIAEQQIARALRGWEHVRHGHQTIGLLMGQLVSVPTDRFWRGPAAGTARRWITAVPAVPETRPQQRSDGQRWTLADAAAVSAGLLWRDRLADSSRRGPDLFTDLHDAVRQLGFRVADLAQATAEPAGNYVHATPEHLVVQPYRAVLDMGRLMNDQSVIALGQSRHLGGGLLLPLDVPEAVVGVGGEALRW